MWDRVWKKAIMGGARRITLAHTHTSRRYILNIPCPLSCVYVWSISAAAAHFRNNQYTCIFIAAPSISSIIQFILARNRPTRVAFGGAISFFPNCLIPSSASGAYIENRLHGRGTVHGHVQTERWITRIEEKSVHIGNGIEERLTSYATCVTLDQPSEWVGLFYNYVGTWIH
jgi:hypothetical protein